MQFHSNKISPPVTIMLGCVVVLVSESKAGWAGFLGALGEVWITPAVTPASHLPSSEHPYRSCRSNKSSPDCLAILVVIRPTPVHLPLRVSSCPYLAFFSQCSPPSTIPRALVSSCRYHRPYLESVHQLASPTCLLTSPPTQDLTPQPPSSPPTWNPSGQKGSTEQPPWTNSPARIVTRTVSLLPQSSTSAWIQLSTLLLHSHK